MTVHPPWLPQSLCYDDFHGDWGKFLEAVYQIFERDFKQSKPCYTGRVVVHNENIEDGREACFWHLVQRGDPFAGDRIPDLRRCERIVWLRPIIENHADPVVSVWEKHAHRGHGRPTETRVLIWLEDFDYLIILAERRNVMILVSAYCTDIESQRRKLRKERDEYYKKQKPPF